MRNILCKDCALEDWECINGCCSHVNNHRYSSYFCEECGIFFCYDCAPGTNASEPYRDHTEDHTSCPSCGKKFYWHELEK